MSSSIASNLHLIRQQITSPNVTLIAVSKTQPADLIRQAFEEGQLDFGENYVDELLEKKSQLSDLPIRWHFIGHLQRRKVKEIVGEVELIHSLDSIGLAHEINKRAAAKKIVQCCLLQVNLSGEMTKSGIQENEIESFLAKAASLTNLKILGLMTFPPFFKDPEQVRPYFRRLHKLLPPFLTELSMGMSHDFQVAIEEGATFIRVGTSIFGEREKD